MQSWLRNTLEPAVIGAVAVGLLLTAATAAAQDSGYRAPRLPGTENPDQSDLDGDGAGDACDPPPVPTVSEWGLILMALLLLTMGTIVFTRRRVHGL